MLNNFDCGAKNSFEQCSMARRLPESDNLSGTHLQDSFTAREENVRGQVDASHMATVIGGAKCSELGASRRRQAARSNIKQAAIGSWAFPAALPRLQFVDEITLSS